MRITFLLLLAANLALLAWFQHFSSADGAADLEPARRQISPEKIRVLHDREPAGAATTAQFVRLDEMSSLNGRTANDTAC